MLTILRASIVLPEPGGPHQQVVSSGSCHFKRPFDVLLALDVLQVFTKLLMLLKQGDTKN